MIPFATVEEYKARYKEAVDDEVLEQCLMDATDEMCSEMERGGVSYTDPKETFSHRLMRVCRAVAHRAMAQGDAGLPAGAKQASVSQGSGSYTMTRSFTLASSYGDVSLTPEERRSLGIGKQRFGFVSPYGRP